jgi:hypothetical protein
VNLAYVPQPAAIEAYAIGFNEIPVIEEYEIHRWTKNEVTVSDR